MKQVRSRIWAAATVVFALGATLLFAQEPSFLTRPQWLKRIGSSVMSVEVLRETLAQVEPGERVEFTQRVLKAVTRLPVGPDEKAAAFVRTAVACIAGVTGDLKYKVIAEVFAGVPVEYLPVVTEELAKRFDQEYNRLSDEAYEKIATEAVKAAVERNAKTDEPSVRNTFVILAFLRGAKVPGLQDKLVALLPDERMRKLAASWLPDALNKRNYDALLAAADVDALSISNETMLNLIGPGALDRLLFELNSGASLSRVIQGSLASVPSSTIDKIGIGDFGINRLPRGYQNQGTNIRKDRDRKTSSDDPVCACPPNDGRIPIRSMR